MNQELFDLYTDYLISAFGPTTATGLSRMLDGQISHDQVTRLLAEPPQNSADLWRNVKPLVRHIERPEATLSVDDSIGGKPFTDENSIVCWHWSHSLDRHVKGIEFLTAFYHVGDVSLPIAFDLVEKTEQYVDAKTGKSKRRSPVTKNQRYGMLLRIAVHNQVPFQYVLNDVWFASADNMKYVKRDLHKDFIMPLKSNRKVALSEGDKRRGQYVAVSTLDIPVATTREIWLEDVPLAVLVVKQVFMNDDGSQGVRYLVTSDLTLDFDRLTTLFQRRWGIEVCQSQPIKMTWCPLRSLRRTMAHLRGGFKREHIGDIHLFSRDDNFTDQAVGYSLTFFKRQPLQIFTQQLAKRLGVFDDLLPVHRLMLRFG